MPKFNLKNKFLFDNLQGLYAIAHIRGGSEYGEEWYRAAIKE
jgi:prolyl oligopeptidase PreP (S9A serine peptidase family)